MSLVDISKRNKDGEKKPTRYFSSKQEKTIAKNLDGKRQKNSGATMFDKGDVVLEDWLIEAKTKTSSSKSIQIKKEWIEKNEKEALFIGKQHNALAFNFGPDEKNYYVIDEYLFQDLVEYLKGKQDD